MIVIDSDVGRNACVGVVLSFVPADVVVSLGFTFFSCLAQSPPFFLPTHLPSFPSLPSLYPPPHPSPFLHLYALIGMTLFCLSSPVLLWKMQSPQQETAE